MLYKTPPPQPFQAVNPSLKWKQPKTDNKVVYDNLPHATSAKTEKIYDDFPLKNQLPTISLDEETDYEADEKENYRPFWPFHKIIFFICFYFIKFFGSKSTITETSKFQEKTTTICLVCYEFYSPKRLIACSAGHRICGKCIRKIARNSAFLSPLETLVKGFPCSEYKCKNYIDYNTCTKFLPKRTRQHIQTKLYEALLKVSGVQFEKCQKCDYLAETPRILGMKIFRCPQCSYTFCCDCGKKCGCNHQKTECFKDSKSLNEVYTDALIHRCYKCDLPFVKETGGLFEGCNTITCKCGATQCYGCRQAVYIKTSYSCSCSKRGLYAERIHKMDIEAAQKSSKKFLNLYY